MRRVTPPRYHSPICLAGYYHYRPLMASKHLLLRHAFLSALQNLPGWYPLVLRKFRGRFGLEEASFSLVLHSLLGWQSFFSLLFSLPHPAYSQQQDFNFRMYRDFRYRYQSSIQSKKRHWATSLCKETERTTRPSSNVTSIIASQFNTL